VLLFLINFGFTIFYLLNKIYPTSTPNSSTIFHGREDKRKRVNRWEYVRKFLSELQVPYQRHIIFVLL